MSRSHTELIDELAKRVDTLALAVESIRSANAVEVSYIREGLRDLQQVARDLQAGSAKASERVAAVEQRCAALDKLADRGWQGWLALIGAGLALLVALLKK